MQTQVENEMTKDEKIRYVDGIRVPYPSFETGLNLIEETHQDGLMTKNPLSLLIYGPSGSGKTTLLETYLTAKQSEQVVETPQGRATNMAILTVQIPSPASPIAVTEKLLKQLGDRYSTKGTSTQKMDRLAELIRKNNVQLIMVDELQHFVDGDKQKVVRRVSDWFKSIVNEITIPFVLFGLEEAQDVLDVNEQFSGRVPTRYELTPFKYDNEYQTFLQDLDEQLAEVFQKQSHLADPVEAQRMFYASKGVMRSIMLLTRRAAKLAIEKNRDSVEQHDFAEAFARYAHIHTGLTVNPFIIDDFDLKDFND